MESRALQAGRVHNCCRRCQRWSLSCMTWELNTRIAEKWGFAQAMIETSWKAGLHEMIGSVMRDEAQVALVPEVLSHLREAESELQSIH